MKWVNEGHEYDSMYEQIQNKKRYYLFGAGDYGTQFLNIFRNEIEIAGYIDNSPKKRNTLINDILCYGFDDVEVKSDEAIILTMSQVARKNAIEQLVAKGFVRNENFFIIEEFISVYNVYKYNKVFFSAISFLPSTACNLKCKNCLNFNPYAKKFFSRSLDELVRDVDLFFSCVDHIMLFHVSGGEPMLYKHTADIIEYIDQNYGDRIDTLRTVTNGTVVPSDETLQKLSKCKIEITVDDYRDAVPEYSENFDRLIQKLKQYNIKHYINKAESWIDLAPDTTDYSGWSDEKLAEHRSSCSQSWQELRGGKLYSCNYAAYATVAGIAGEQDSEEAYDLTTYVPEDCKKLVEFRLGYTRKGYTNFCKTCRGFTPYNTDEMTPAEQAK